MQDADVRMLELLEGAIKQAQESGVPNHEKRDYLMSCLRITHAQFMGARMWQDAFLVHRLLKDVGHAALVSEARAAIRARIGDTPVTNRGVTHAVAVLRTENHAN